MLPLWLIAAVVAATMGQSSARAETSVTAEAGMAVEYNDNLRLAVEDEQDAVGRSVSLGARFFLAGPERDIRIAPSLRAQRYAGASELDDDDYFLDVGAEQRFEYSTLSLRGNYYRDTPLTGDVGTTGLVEIGVRRERAGVRPAWMLELSPRSKLNLGLGYDEVRYARDTVIGSTVDYEVASATAGYVRELAQGEELGVTLSVQRLDAPEISNRADHQGAQLDYASALADRLHLSATLGYQRSRFEQGTGPAVEDSGALFDLRLIREGEYHAASLGLTRSIEPSGTGTLMRSDDLSLSARAELTPALTASLSLLWSDRTDLQGIDPASDRRVEQVQAGVSRSLSERVSLSALYRFIRQRLEPGDAVADSNALVFTLTYAGEPVALAH